MGSIVTFLKGKKTYIIAFVTALLAGAGYLGIEIPAWVPTLLAALGLTTIRSAISDK